MKIFVVTKMGLYPEDGEWPVAAFVDEAKARKREEEIDAEDDAYADVYEIELVE